MEISGIGILLIIGGTQSVLFRSVIAVTSFDSLSNDLQNSLSRDGYTKEYFRDLAVATGVLAILGGLFVVFKPFGPLDSSLTASARQEISEYLSCAHGFFGILTILLHRSIVDTAVSSGDQFLGLPVSSSFYSIANWVAGLILLTLALLGGFGVVQLRS